MFRNRPYFILFLLNGLISTFGAEIPELIKKLPAQNAEDRERLSADLFKEGVPGIATICKLLLEPGKGDDSKARFALHAMAVHASRPGGDADRKVFADALAAELGGNAGPQVKAF